MSSVSTADGVRLEVEASGPGTAPVTVLLSHGWTLDRRIWAPVAARLLELPRPPQVVSYDHRGHGRSDRVDESTMTIDQLADDLAEVVAAAAPTGPLVLVGHSMGGMTLMALAERHPEVAARASGIALVSTAAGGIAATTFGLPAGVAAVARSVERRVHASSRWADRSSLGSPRLLAPGLRWLLLGADPDAEARRLTTQVVCECPPRTVAGFRPTLDAHERAAALKAFAAVPVRVLVGSRDRLTPVTSSRLIAEALPEAELTVFPGAGHMLPLERPAGVAERVAALVRGV